MPAGWILALDQGTTSSRAIIFDHDGRPVTSRQRELAPQYPRAGWVEHDPEEIWDSQMEVARQVMSEQGLSAGHLTAIGITNQRETTVVWDRKTGQAVYNAIVWQDRRTAEYCDSLKRDGWEEHIRRKTGLVIDPYFSATKLRWILQHVDGAQAKAERGDLLFGTVDSFLLWRLIGGKVHATDYSNAARTMLFNIHGLEWDDDLLHELAIPRAMLPEVRPSSSEYGMSESGLLGGSIPLAGVAGDQQAATFGQACYRPGMVKNTYGTGNFMLMNTGDTPRESKAGLLTTIAWGIGDAVVYALEGSIFVTGSAVQWLRDQLQVIGSAAEIEDLARQTSDTGGVYFVPAFAGLGAPYWDPYARGTIVGLTRGTGLPQIARATLDSVAYQSRDVLEAMRSDSGLEIADLRVDGGMVVNDVLMQFQADITNTRVQRPIVQETTALGAAYLAGLAVGFWESQEELERNWAMDREFEPSMDDNEREQLYTGWKRAVERSRGWVEPDQQSDIAHQAPPSPAGQEKKPGDEGA
jgi:glycerol kinase